ncbi:IclR family transcriptional regulator [Streptomyces sp. ME03-5709C]|nr:IclR family transcriptional regulator [Streptomyces sp. ME03-5709C]
MNSIEKTLAALRALALPGAPHRLADIATAAGVGKTSAHRILQVLVANNYASHTGEGGYAPGPAFHALSASESLRVDLGAVATPLLVDLQNSVGHTVHFAVRSGRAAVYAAKIEGDRPYRMASRVGTQIPLHCTAVGKAVLAAMPRPEARALLEDPDSPLGGDTELEALIAELDVVAERGFSIDDEENEPNVRCVGAVVRGAHNEVIGGVSVSGLTYTFSMEDLHRAAPAVMTAARRLSVALGAELSAS